MTGEAEGGLETGAAPSQAVIKNYSEHYSEDIDTLLQFITSSEKNPKAKSTKQTQQQKSQEPKQGEKKKNADVASKTAKQPNNESLKAKKQSKNKENQAANKDSEEEEREEVKVEEAKVEAKEEVKEKVVETFKPVAIPPVPVEIDDANDLASALSASLNNSGEFVTVKGRKLRKSAKKEPVPAPAPNKLNSSKPQVTATIAAPNQIKPKPVEPKDAVKKSVSNPIPKPLSSKKEEPIQRLSIVTIPTQPPLPYSTAAIRGKPKSNEPSKESSNSQSILTDISPATFPPLKPASAPIEPSPKLDKVNKPSEEETKISEKLIEPKSDEAEKSEKLEKEENILVEQKLDAQEVSRT